MINMKIVALLKVSYPDVYKYKHMCVCVFVLRFCLMYRTWYDIYAQTILLQQQKFEYII